MNAMSQDLFDGVVPFVATSEARSFGVAAKRLGVTASAVSKAIARLEENLGVGLLHRTSRSVTLTEEGEAFLLRCRVAIGEVRAARATLHDSQRAPRGLLRISLPHRLGRIVMSNLSSLLEAHPLLAVEASLTDGFAHLIDENIDVALRVGELVNSTCIAHRLRVLRILTVASPAYLEKNGSPRTPEQHNCLAFLLQTGLAFPRSGRFS
jgi:DNA-binding transcriptional LysR family regulator